MGGFITFEGIEGSGKSTHMGLLALHLKDAKIPAVITQEPSGTAIGRKIGDILFNRSHQGMFAETELLLFCAARAQLVREIILPALEAGIYVVCDRFSDATFAYQACGRGLDAAFIKTMNDYCAPGLKPDLTLLFDLQVETGLQRAAGRDAKLADPAAADRFEREKIDFHHRVRDGYERLRQAEPERFRVIDASRTVELVAADVRRLVMDFIKNGKRSGR